MSNEEIMGWWTIFQISLFFWFGYKMRVGKVEF